MLTPKNHIDYASLIDWKFSLNSLVFECKMEVSATITNNLSDQYTMKVMDKKVEEGYSNMGKPLDSLYFITDCRKTTYDLNIEVKLTVKAPHYNFFHLDIMMSLHWCVDQMSIPVIFSFWV